VEDGVSNRELGKRTLEGEGKLQDGTTRKDWSIFHALKRRIELGTPPGCQRHST
jgi:hypothetical protein